MALIPAQDPPHNSCFHTLRPLRRASLKDNFSHAKNRAGTQVVVNGRVIHCVAVKHLQGVGAAALTVAFVISRVRGITNAHPVPWHWRVQKN